MQPLLHELQKLTKGIAIGTDRVRTCLALLHQALVEKIEATIGADEWDRLVAEVVERNRDPYTTADELARRIGLVPAE